MTTATLARLPLAAAGAVLSAAGHLITWGFARYMRAPLANTGILALMTFSAMAGSNALYMQDRAHPQPLFVPSGRPVASIAPVVVEPVVPATRSHVVEAEPVVEQASVPALPSADGALGNAEVTEIQRKLTSMQIFDGKVDGIYGPRTARAIKTFEQRMGFAPKGELTRSIYEAIRSAPVILPETPARQAPAPQPAALEAVEAPPARTEPAPQPPAEAVLRDPLPNPAPLQMQAEAPARPAPRGRELPETPEQAMDLAVRTAGEAIDTIVDGVQSLAMTTPGRSAAELTTGSIAPAAPVTAPASAPRVGVPLAVVEEPAGMTSENIPELDTEARVEELMAPFSVSDPVIVARVQRGLASLGFLYGPADGIAGEATAKAIRNFEVYYNYKVTGRISPELLDLLVDNGASI